MSERQTAKRGATTTITLEHQQSSKTTTTTTTKQTTNQPNERASTLANHRTRTPKKIDYTIDAVKPQKTDYKLDAKKKDSQVDAA